MAERWTAPKSPKDAVNQWYALMKRRVAIEAELDRAKAEERNAEKWLLGFYPQYVKRKMEYIEGDHCFLELVPFDKVKLDDFESFMQYVRAGKGARDDLLYKRASETTVRNYWQKGIEVPGVVPEAIIKPSYRSV